MLCENKYVLYAVIKPYDLKISLVFSKDSRVRYMQEFVEDTMRNFRTKYRVGRIEQKKTASILLPDYKIGEVLEDKDEIVVYSAEYGLTKKTLSDKSSIEDIDKLFIGKKLKRDSRVISRKNSNDKNIKKKEGESEEEYNDDNNDDNNEEEEEDEDNNKDEKNENNDKNVKNEKNFKNDKNRDKKKDKDKKNNKDDNSSNSGDDNSEDIQL